MLRNENDLEARASAEDLSGDPSDSSPMPIKTIERESTLPSVELVPISLFEADSARLPAVTALAERAIFSRYLELQLNRVQSDEGIDLWDTADALTQLKEANCNGYPRQKFVV
jgi:hypothetical protein